VNVSVAGGRRVEIKGVHHHRRLPLLVHIEAFRQLNLLRVRAKLEERGVTEEALPEPPPGLTWETSPLVLDAGPILADSNFPPIRKAILRGDTISAIKLPGFGGLLSHPTQPGTTFAHELADRVRVIACPRHYPFLAHSDAGRGGLVSRHWKMLARDLKADSGDAMVVVWASQEDSVTGVREVLIRAREALAGIPAETRQANPDGTNGFERILPGPDRMYPDTDTPPLPIPDSMVAEVRAQVGESPWERETRYLGLGLDPRAAKGLSVAPWADLFDQVGPREGEPARRLASVLEKRVPFHARNGQGRKPRTADETPDPGRIAPAVRALEAGEVRNEALPLILDRLLSDPERPVAEVLDEFRPRPGDDKALQEKVVDVASTVKASTFRSPEAALRWALGEVLRQFWGRVSPSEVEVELRKLITPPPHREGLP
jgi:Glu-tRNA(Gln) amidotransferase subunit E-like FAD-binding protein